MRESYRPHASQQITECAAIDVLTDRMAYLKKHNPLCFRRVCPSDRHWRVVAVVVVVSLDVSDEDTEPVCSDNANVMSVSSFRIVVRIREFYQLPLSRSPVCPLSSVSPPHRHRSCTLSSNASRAGVWRVLHYNLSCYGALELDIEPSRPSCQK